MKPAADYLEETRAIEPDGAARYGVEIKPLKRGGDGVTIAYRKNGEVYGHKIRPLEPGDGPRFFFHPTGAKRDLWNVDALADETMRDMPVIITEGELDALSCIQSGFPRTVSIPDGWSDKYEGGDGPKSKAILQNLDRIKQSPFIIAAGDGDDTGASFIRAVANLLEGHPVKYLVYPEHCKDANDVLRKYGQAELVATILAAKWCDPEGGLVTGFSDIPPQLPMQIYRPGFPPFDDVVLFHAGFLTVVTGVPGSGKTTFTTCAANHAGKANSVRVAFGLFETPATYLRDHLTRLETGKPWAMLTEAERKKKNLDDLDRRFRVMHMTHVDDRSHDMGWIKAMMNAATVRDGSKIVVFDPWNEIEHLLDKGETMTNYLNCALSKIHQWSERFDCATVIVAHPAKMMNGQMPLGYDISDSAAWFNKAAIGITVHQQKDDPFVTVANWKSKFQQEYRIGKGIRKFQFDAEGMCYRGKFQ